MKLGSNDFLDLDNKYGARNYNPLPVVITKAKGIWVWDVEGKKYIDCLSAYSSQNLGHCNDKILEVMEKQMKDVTLTSRAFANDKMGIFLRDLCNFVEPHLNLGEGDEVVALPMNTGAEAVETALKVIRAWSYIKKKIPLNESNIIVCKGNFHGRTITVVGFSSDMEHGRYHDYFGPFTPNFHMIEFGKIGELEKKIQEIGPDKVAGFLFEPIQGENGVKIPPKGWLQDVRDTCSKYNVLMVADEIQTGLSRTGYSFACDFENVKPDMICVGKALGGGVYPVSAVVTRKEIMGENVIKPGVHGSTFGGNPLASSIATKVIQIIQEENLSKKSQELGDYFVQGLKSIQEKYDKVVEVRGRGLLVAIELNVRCRPYALDLMEKGILVKETHDSVKGGSIRFAPPLIIEKEEIDYILKVLEEVLKK
ncbi:MAG: ornithine--oxo-acid transaminase [Candidatus Ranarchaeia archaeon]